ncbi:MAG: 3-hydroxyacyl-CoA dehydrogenase/enoyl-CoA hydratase family protein [Deltaproteobacteria bacterium]|nr:3-hydroxyacyl-CoA dehydrogenase/enoyl-CoA hydratase family protein [Deltaproteobacteria bacterium]
MSHSFRKVAVLGAGVMGSGIAAHLANAGIPSLLLDIVPPGGLTEDDKKKGVKATDRSFRNRFSQGGLEKAIKSSPAQFFINTDARLVEVGNLEDDLAKIADCDWVCEVVKEDLGVKRDLFQRVVKHLHKDAILSSNTSGLKIQSMMEGFSADVRRRFLVTHFFNPVRYMNLLEVIPGAETSADVVGRFKEFGSLVLGKGVVMGKDTPNFIGNRIGVYGIMETIRVMMEDGYNIDEVDAVFGTAMGRAKSAVFRTADVVGLDTFVHVSQNCYDNLPDDEMRDVFKVPDFIKEMVKRNMLGNKSGQGFYKKVGSEILTLNLKTFEYEPKKKVRSDALGAVKDMDDPGEKCRTLCFADDRLGALAWKVTSRTLAYAARRIGEIADDIVNIDRAMRWGFGWEQGPFESWDSLGVGDACTRMDRDGTPVDARVRDMLKGGRQRFYESHGGVKTYFDFARNAPVNVDEGFRVMRVPALKEAGHTLKENMGASILDLGDGILGLEFHTKMNAIDADIVEMLNQAVEMAESDYLGLVIANDGPLFSAGANLMLIYMEAQNQAWDNIRKAVTELQASYQRMRYCKVPVVAAPFQLTLGGGCEMCLWAPSVRAHAELYMGLVEVGVGLLPAGGGTTEMTIRAVENAPDDPGYPLEGLIRKNLETIAMAKVSMSAEEARRLGFLRPSDGITLNRDHLLYAAKQQALGMARAGYRAPRPRAVRLPGPSARATFSMALRAMRDGHMMSDHDLLISEKIAHVMTGGDTSPRVLTSENRLLELECEAFLSLCGEVKTQERIQYMLMNNKPLRN